MLLCSVACSDAFDLYFGVVIFRLRAGFDATELKVTEEGGGECEGEGGGRENRRW